MKKIVVAVLFVLLFMFVYMFFQVGISFIYGIVLAIKLIFESRGNFDPSVFLDMQTIILEASLYLMLVSVIVSLPIYYIICKLRNQNIFTVCEFNKISFKTTFLTAVLGIATSIFLSCVLSFIPINEFFPEHNELIYSLMGGHNLFEILLVTGLVAPFIEEVIFRGLILKELKKIMPISLAVVIQAILFGLYHFNPLQIIYASLLGILLGLVAVWTRSIWSSIILHAFINTTSTFLGTFLTDENIMNNIYTFLIVCIVIIVAIVIYLKRNSKGKLNNVNDRIPNNI